MEASKKAAFVRAMGKRQKFSKGGLIRKIGNRHYFDGGGPVMPAGGPVTGQSLTTIGGPGTGTTTQNAANPNTGVLGTVGGALGLNNNFQASSANIQQGTNAAQLNKAYQGAQQAIDAQGNLVNVLAPQAATGAATQNAVENQQLGIMNGTGPNPAQAELAQETAQNVAQTGAEMAGARGASGNVGLMAREIGQQGAATQQQATGQAATLEAQQQIAAGQNAAALAGTQIGQAGQAVQGLNTAQQNEQNTLQGANTSANNAAVGMQSNINNTNAATAASNQGMAGQILGGISSAASSALGSLAKGGVVEKEHHVKLAEMNAAALAHGKENYADGGPIVGNPLVGSQNTSAAPSFGGQYAPMASSSGPNIQSTPSMPSNSGMPSLSEGLAKTGENIGSMLGDSEEEAPSAEDSTAAWMQTGASGTGPGGKDAWLAKGGNVCDGPHKSHVANFLFSGGGKVPAMVSPGEVYLSPEKVRQVIQEGANPMKVGQKIPGNAKVKNDSLKNDTVPMTLEEGGVVIPRHITAHKKMAAEKAELFVHRALARKKARR